MNRNNYYQEGWLATGNVRGVVGVTFTSSHARRPHELPLRTNYNLRGHRSDVSHYTFKVYLFYTMIINQMKGIMEMFFLKEDAATVAEKIKDNIK